jgi:hypothetical protein
MFMALFHSFEKNRINSAKKSPSAARVLAALLAAVLPQVGREPAEGVIIGGVVVERAFAPRLHHARVDQPLEMMTQRRCWELDVLLDGAGRRTFWPGLDDEAEDRESHGMAQGAQLSGMVL